MLKSEATLRVCERICGFDEFVSRAVRLFMCILFDLDKCDWLVIGDVVFVTAFIRRIVHDLSQVSGMLSLFEPVRMALNSS